MSRLIIIIAATLAACVLATPAAQASELSQRGPHHGHAVGIWHHGAGFHHPGWGFRGPGFGLAPFLPVVALPPPVVAVPVPVQIPVAVPVAAPYAPVQVSYPALPAAAPSCGCPSQ